MWRSFIYFLLLIKASCKYENKKGSCSLPHKAGPLRCLFFTVLRSKIFANLNLVRSTTLLVCRAVLISRVCYLLEVAGPFQTYVGIRFVLGNYMRIAARLDTRIEWTGGCVQFYRKLFLNLTLLFPIFFIGVHQLSLWSKMFDRLISTFLTGRI